MITLTSVAAVFKAAYPSKRVSYIPGWFYPWWMYGTFLNPDPPPMRWTPADRRMQAIMSSLDEEEDE